MYQLLRIYFVLIIYSKLCKGNDTQFLADFFKLKHINLITLHTCYQTRETILLLNDLHRNNIRTLLHTQPKPYHQKDYFNHRFGFVVDITCGNWDKFLREKLAYVKYRIQKHGLILCKTKKDFDRVKGRLDTFDFRLDSNVYITVRNLKDENKYFLYEIYNVAPMTGKKFENTLNYTNGNFEFSKTSRYEIRRNFDDIFLQVAFVVTDKYPDPKAYLADRRTKQFDTSSKTNFGVFDHVVDVHNFRWSLVETPSWFGSTKHGTETGLANVISKGIADISGSSGLMTVGRAETFDFLVGTFLFRTCFMFRNPGMPGLMYDEYVKPFSPGTWLCILASIGIIAFFFVMAQTLHGKLTKDTSTYSIAYIIVYIVSAFCQQGVSMNMNFTTGRLILFTLLMLTFLLYNYYTSSIVSSLINSKRETFKDVDELVKSDFKLGIEGIAFKRVLNATNNPTLIYLQNRAVLNKSKIAFYPQNDGIAKIQNAGFAYLVEAITAYDYIARKFSNEEICELTELEAMRPTVLYLVARKHGPYNEILSITYRRLVQHGLLYRQNKIFGDEKPTCQSTVQFAQVGIEHAAPAIILLILGYILAVVILLMERNTCKLKILAKNIRFLTK